MIKKPNDVERRILDKKFRKTKPNAEMGFGRKTNVKRVSRPVPTKKREERRKGGK